jgi:amino acid permease
MVGLIGIETEEALGYNIEICLIVAVIIMPLSTIKNMSGFRYITILTHASVLYIAIVLLFELPMYIR